MLLDALRPRRATQGNVSRRRVVTVEPTGEVVQGQALARLLTDAAVRSRRLHRQDVGEFAHPQTPFTLGGKYDFLLRYDSGTWGIIDTKVSSSADKADFYWPQLAAYDHILANPKSGDPRRCETLGVLVWAIGTASHHDADEYRVGFNATYEPVTVDPKRFDAFIADVVTVLMGEMPGRGEKCENCNYFENRSRLTP